LTKGRIEEKSGRLSKNLNVFWRFLSHCRMTPTFHKSKVQNDHSKFAINKFRIKYWISMQTLYKSNFSNIGAPFIEYVNIEEKVWFLVKKYRLPKTDSATKITSLYGRNRAVYLNLGWKIHLLRQVWWVLP
jgi:hypothetical protein